MKNREYYLNREYYFEYDMDLIVRSKLSFVEKCLLFLEIISCFFLTFLPFLYSPIYKMYEKSRTKSVRVQNAF